MLIPIFDLVSVGFFTAALLLAWKRMDPAFSGPARLFLAASLSLYVFVGISNVLEHSGVTAVLDPIENYAEILFVPLFLIFLYAVVVEQEGRRRLETLHDLQVSEMRYRTLVENIDMGIALIGRNFRVVMANSSQEKMIGVSPGGLVGRMCYEIMMNRRTPLQPLCRR